MTEQVLFDKRYGKLIFNQEMPYIMYKAISFMTAKQFRDILNQLLYFYNNKKRFHDYLYIIADTRLQGKIAPAERIWLEEYWNYEMYKSGLREIAFVVPYSIISKRFDAMPETPKHNHNYYLEKGLFTNVKESIQWLESRKTSFQPKYTSI